MVRDDHIELVGVIYTQKSGEYHGVRQLQFYKGSWHQSIEYHLLDKNNMVD